MFQLIAEPREQKPLSTSSAKSALCELQSEAKPGYAQKFGSRLMGGKGGKSPSFEGIDPALLPTTCAVSAEVHEFIIHPEQHKKFGTAHKKGSTNTLK